LLHSDNRRNRLVGIGLMSVCFLCFALLDCGAKWLVQSLPVLMVVWFRFFFHAVFATALHARQLARGLPRPRKLKLQLLRACFLPVMTGFNFWALQYLQLAETGAIQFSVPILIALFAAPILGERMDRARWIAISLGFVGVLIIVRPGTSGFHPALVLSLVNAVLYALYNLVTRHLAAHDSAETTQFITSIGATLIITPIALAALDLHAPTAFQWFVLAAIGLAGGLGHYLIAVAHKYAPANVLAPFLYQQIVWMVLLGYLVFGDVPDAAVMLGAAIVIASGAYLLYRER
jgi:drug/metabolite transporter (DMT)-like permease